VSDHLLPGDDHVTPPRVPNKYAFMNIFWGLLFIVVDIKIDNIDFLVPDLIGYVVIYAALQRLGVEAVDFRRARPFAVGGAIASVFAMIPMSPIQPFAILQTLFDMVLIWHVCNGIVCLADRRNNAGLSAAAINGRRLYLAAAVINVLAAPLGLAAPDVLRILVVPVVAFSLIATLLVMLLLTRASAEAA
jgi:hypothetical protein